MTLREYEITNAEKALNEKYNPQFAFEIEDFGVGHDLILKVKDMRRYRLRTVRVESHYACDIIAKATEIMNELDHCHRKDNTISIDDVIFQDDKATIIKWSDGTKSVVKCSKYDTFSPEAGIALCFMKKIVADNDSEEFHKLLKNILMLAKPKYSKIKFDNSAIKERNIYLRELWEAFKDGYPNTTA